jgi:hypothetical protein
MKIYICGLALGQIPDKPWVAMLFGKMSQNVISNSLYGHKKSRPVWTAFL